MAYIKIFPIKATVKNAIDYISNPDKTDEQLLVSTFGCSLETADLEFSMTREEGKRNVYDRNGNLAFHLIQSFKPGEVSAEKAHELGKEFADKVLKGKHEYVLSTHIDKNHVHNHIVFNATNFTDFHKYVSNKRDYHRICNISNQICHEYGLAESLPNGNKGKTYKENQEYNKGTSWKAKLKVAVDKAIWSSISYEEFLLRMKEQEYEIRQGKYLAFRAPEQANFTNLKSLGSYYSDENVIARIEKNRYRLKLPKNITREVRLFINISTYVTTGNHAGFEQWAQLNNLKEAAKTFNYLSENNLLNYDDFQNHIADIDGSVESCNKRMTKLEDALSTKRLIQKQCDTYRHCKKIVDGEKDKKYKKAYQDSHAQEYKLHEISKRTLKELGIEKLPNPDRLQAEIENLQKERAAVTKELQQLQKKQQTLQTVQSNFHELLADNNTTLSAQHDLTI